MKYEPYAQLPAAGKTEPKEDNTKSLNFYELDIEKKIK